MPTTFDPAKTVATKAKIDAMHADFLARKEAEANKPKPAEVTTKSLEQRRSNLGAMFAAGQAPHVTSGPLGEKGFSYTKLWAYLGGAIGADQAKEEIQICTKTRALYEANGFVPDRAGSFIVPLSGRRMMFRNAKAQEGEKFAVEVSQKLAAGVGQTVTTKANMNTGENDYGGAYVGPPMFGDLIDAITNATWLDKAGAKKVDLGPTNRVDFPKRRTKAAGYWVGEGEDATVSNPRTDTVKMQGKKFRVFSSYTNDLLRFSSVNLEQLFREDMAITAAQMFDAAALTGDGSKEPRGLLNYTTQTAFSQTVDAVIKIAAGTVATDGDTFTWGDDARLWAALPVAVDKNLTWLMTKALSTKISNLRADAVSANDGKGSPLYIAQSRQYMDIGEVFTKGRIINAETLPTDRVKGSGTNLQALIAGDFSRCYWATSPVMEVLVDNLTGALNDATKFYGTMYGDVGFSQLAAFGYIDNLLVS